MMFTVSQENIVPYDASTPMGRAPSPSDPRERLRRGFRTLDTALDEKRGALWYFMRPESGLACFTPELLDDIRSLQLTVRAMASREGGNGRAPFRYVVMDSHVPGIFNLGGDLALFANKIRQRDRAALSTYGHASIDLVHDNANALGLPLITVALVRGDALGGGFECALSHDLIVAERSAKFGLPEILFNLFPGMGAYSFLSRRIGSKRAERMILGGRIHGAEELHEMGVVDVLAEDGAGEIAVHELIERGLRRHNGTAAIYAAGRRINPVPEGELRDVVELWVDAAMRLEEPDLRKMERLASAQRKRVAAATPVLVREAAE